MSNRSLRRVLYVTLMTVVWVSGCSLLSESRSLRSSGLRSVDGLDRADIDLAGVLELREDHGIGGYDRVSIPPATLTYKRDSLRLTTPARRVFLRLLRQSLTEATEASGIPIERDPGQCTMEIELGALGLDLALGKGAEHLARVTIVMQFRDSLSREPLLRYSTERLIENPELGVDHNEHLKEGLDQIVADLNIAGSLRGAGLADDEIRPGCNGTFAKLGRAAQARERQRR